MVLLKNLFTYLVLLVLFLESVSGIIPQRINYQGRLADAGGNPLNGNYKFVFKIFDAETIGTGLWTETQDSVNITNGVFNIQLGSLTAISTEIFDSSPDRWLEISVGPAGGSEQVLSPRIKFISQPYSYISEKTYGVIGATITTANIADNAIIPAKMSTNSYEHIRVGTATVSIVANSVFATNVTAGNLNNNVIASSIAINSIGTEQVSSIAGTKISPNFGSQNIFTSGAIGISSSNPIYPFYVKANGDLWSIFQSVSGGSFLRCDSKAGTWPYAAVFFSSGSVNLWSVGPMDSSNGNFKIINQFTGDHVINIQKSNEHVSIRPATDSDYGRAFYVVGDIGCSAGLYPPSASSLPTTGYDRGSFFYNTSNDKMYVSTQTVVGVQSWKSLW